MITKLNPISRNFVEESSQMFLNFKIWSSRTVGYDDLFRIRNFETLIKIVRVISFGSVSDFSNLFFPCPRFQKYHLILSAQEKYTDAQLVDIRTELENQIKDTAANRIIGSERLSNWCSPIKTDGIFRMHLVNNATCKMLMFYLNFKM